MYIDPNLLNVISLIGGVFAIIAAVATFIHFLRVKKLNTRLTVVIIALIIIIAGALGYEIFVNAVFTPFRAMTAYCDALLKPDYSSAYDFFANNSVQKTKEGKDQFISQAKIENASLVNCSVNGIQQVSSNVATAELIFQNNGTQYTTEYHLVKDGDWKIVSITRK